MRPAVRIGAIAGAVTIFLAAVGLIGNFTDLNLIGTQVTFAGLMIVTPPLLAGYVAITPRVEAGQLVEFSRGQALAAGATAGTLAGAVFGAFVVFVDAFGVEKIREVFINISPTLMEYLTRGRPSLVAAAILVVVSMAAGAGGAWYRRLSDPIRRPLGTAVWVTLLFGFLQRIVPIALDQLDVERDWMYSKVTGGLTWVGAVVIVAVAAGPPC